jgi:hypothetical protein
MDDPPTLKSLMFHWEDGYLFAYARDRWIAIRRDGLMFVAADTLSQLEAEIEFDCEKNPVLHECDTLDATRNYLYVHHGSDLECTDDLVVLVVHAAEAIALDAAEHSVMLHDLRALFPDWDIEYSEQMKAWIAHRKDATICENSPLLIHIALTRIERVWKHSGNDTGHG